MITLRPLRGTSSSRSDCLERQHLSWRKLTPLAAALLILPPLAAQVDYYNTLNTATSPSAFSVENWNSPVNNGGVLTKKWVTGAAPTTYTQASVGNHYHTNGFSMRIGRIGNTSGGNPNPYVFTGARLILDGYNPASNVSSTNSSASSEIFFNLHAAANPANLATYQANIVIAATAPGVMHTIRADIGQTTLQGTLQLDGNLQLLPTNGSTTSMTLDIQAPISGTGNITIAGGSTGGAVVAGSLKWVFNDMSGWTGTVIAVTRKNTISFGANNDFYTNNPSASLILDATAFLDLSANVSFQQDKISRNGIAPAPGTYNAAALNTLWGANSVTGSGSLYVGPAIQSQPAITTQPQNISTGPGADVVFTVVATGGALTYQWYKDGNSLTGETTATLRINDAKVSDDADYYVIVSNDIGNVQSNTVSLSVATPPPAFPGAEGAGALSIGGRGGRIIKVTTLDDYAANESVVYGSLRAALAGLISPTETHTGPKIVVFTVGGTIQLKRGLLVDQPYLTVAGQTAPGGGIQLKCSSTTPDTVLTIVTHDVIWRYTRFRRGHYPDPNANRHQCVTIANGGYNIILDHNTIMWSMDEGLGIWSENSLPGAPPHNITASWCLIAEQLRVHSTQNLVGASSTANADRMTNISAIKNYMANSNHRNPQFKAKSGNYVSNLMYNARRYQMQAGPGAELDVISNYYKQPATYNNLVTHEFDFYPDPDAYSLGNQHMYPSGAASYYVAGNIGQNNPDGSLDNWTSMVRRINDQNLESTLPYDPNDPNSDPDPLQRGGPLGSGESALSTSWKRSPWAPRAAVGYPIVPFDAATLPEQLLETVGASQRLDEYGQWIENRDSTDERVVLNYFDNTGWVPVTENDVTPQSGTSGPPIGGYPTLAAGTAYTDADDDGLPDAWETLYGVSDPDADPDGDGYSNIEEFINGTDPLIANVVDSTPPVLTVPAPITTPSTSPAGAPVTFSVSALDAIDGSLPVTSSHVSGSTFPIGTTWVHVSAVDANGNIKRGMFEITVTP